MIGRYETGEGIVWLGLANQQPVANCNRLYHCLYMHQGPFPEALVIRDCGDFTVALRVGVI